jgi:hypothetical protein
VVASSPEIVRSSVANIALVVGEPAAICWHWRHQHWRTVTASPVIVAVTAPQAQRPV